MRIALLQTPAFDLDNAREAAAYLIDAIDRAALQRPDLILLPEMAYPAYYLPGILTAADLDRRLTAQGAPTTAAFAATVQERAVRHRIHIAAGMGLAGPDGRLRNAMALYDREGQERVRAGKQFLWHFDSCWFAPGDAPPVATIDGVPVGLFICADGRAPEIPRRLAVAGARLFLDATNWVTSGRDPAALPNAQPDYMMRVRALENGCFFAAANKAGREADSIVYCGKSCAIGPDGAVLAMASSDRPEMLIVDVPVTAGPGPGPNAPLGLVQRRSGEYQRLAAPETPLAGGDAPVPFVAVLQVPDDDPRLPVLLQAAAIQGVDLAVLPEGDQPLTYWQELSNGCDFLLLATGRDGDQRVAWLLERGRVLGRYAKGHLSDADRAAGLEPGPSAEPPVFATAAGRIGVMIGEDGLVPEVARGLTLAGADLIAWPHRLTAGYMEPFIRTRAAENRVYVAAAGRAEPGGEAMVADPAGLPLTRTFPGARQLAAANCLLAAAREKGIVPGTSALDVPRYPELG
jgi:predicted amidohydrolase